MPADDPTEELALILDMGALNVLPPNAVRWAESALEKSESILATIESMLDNGVDAPTEKQVQALRNMHEAARAWLPEQHIIDRLAPRLAALREQRDAHERLPGGRSPTRSSLRASSDRTSPTSRPRSAREVAIESILSAAQQLGVNSKHPTYKIPSPEAKPFRLVLGDPDRDRGQALYHLGDCPVLASEIHQAKICTDAKPKIKLFALIEAKRHGIACPVCLVGLSKARVEHFELKPCRVAGADGQDNGLLLRWRQDSADRWYGLILRHCDDSVLCEVVASNQLEPMPE